MSRIGDGQAWASLALCRGVREEAERKLIPSLLRTFVSEREGEPSWRKQTRTTSGAPLFIWAPHAVSHVAVVGRAPAGMGGMPDAGGDVGRMSEMGGGTGVDSFHAIGDRG